MKVSHVHTGHEMHFRVDLLLSTQYAHALRLTPSRAKRPQVEFDPYIQIILQPEIASTEPDLYDQCRTSANLELHANKAEKQTDTSLSMRSSLPTP